MSYYYVEIFFSFSTTIRITGNRIDLICPANDEMLAFRFLGKLSLFTMGMTLSVFPLPAIKTTYLLQ